ncbi:hypothetical protein PG993_015123 [Apiospora rasikravindrae]|uniref:Uncharacterized protein n=1 Tax=Apiospora rasikravindrae TaxID=990691 RepID=A0ABR1RPN5_9PEZI
MKTPDSDADIDVESWVLEETNILENTFRFTDVTGSYDANSAEFKPLGDEPFSYNIVGLTGCTAMVLLSKRGIYIAHYFENIAFNKDRNSPYKSQQTAFLHTVQQGLRRGRLNEQVSLASNAIAIDDDSLHGFLIIPKTGPGNDNTQIVEDPYREWWEKIKTTVGSILPRLNDPGRWHEYKYAPQQEEQIVRDEQGEAIYEPIWATSSGRVLFKYDPDHNGRKKTLLYFEKERMEAANMEW